MADIHANRGRMSVGQYSYTDARKYRDATNNAWIEATVKLVDPSADPQRIKKYQRFASLTQHVDDVWDCIKDAEVGSQNLFLGLAKDMSREHPEELAALKQYIDTPKKLRPKQSIKGWIRKNIPHTRAAYADNYHNLLQQSHGLTKTIFWGAGKTL